MCFNENVRSAEDVFRCHNDFIRDTANASNLQLSTIEWSQFFGVENSLSQGNIGVSMLVGAPLGGPPDLLGRMNPDELGKFRTTWCTKRYEHDHDLYHDIDLDHDSNNDLDHGFWGPPLH